MLSCSRALVLPCSLSRSLSLALSLYRSLYLSIYLSPSPPSLFSLSDTRAYTNVPGSLSPVHLPLFLTFTHTRTHTTHTQSIHTPHTHTGENRMVKQDVLITAAVALISALVVTAILLLLSYRPEVGVRMNTMVEIVLVSMLWVWYGLGALLCGIWFGMANGGTGWCVAGSPAAPS